MGHMGMGGMSPMGGGRGGRGNAAATAAEIAMVGLSKQPPGRVAAAAARFNEADRAQHDRNLGNFITSGGAGVNRSNAAHAAEGEATSGEMPVIESGGDVEEEEDSEAIMRKKKKKKQKARATNDRRRTSGKERSSSSISRTSEKSRRSSMKKKIGFAAAGGREDHAKATMSGSGGNYNYHRMSKQGAGKHKGGEGESLPSAQRASTAHTPSRAKASSDTKNPLLRKSVGRRMVRHGEGESMPSADSHSFLDSLKEHDQHGKSSGGKKSGGGGGGKPVHHLHPDHHVDDHKDLRSHDAKMEDGEKHKSSKQHHTESVTEETHQKKSHPSRKVIQGEGSGLFDDSRSSNRRSPRSGSSSRRNDRGGSSSRRDDRGGSSSRRDDRGGSSSRRNDRGGHSSRRDDRGGSSSRRDDRGGHASRRDDRGRHSSRQDQGKKEKGGKLKIRVAEVDERGKVIKVTGGTLEDLTREEQKLAQKAYRKAPLGEDTIFMTSKRIKGGRDVHGREGRSSHRGGRGRGEGSAHHHDHSGMTEMRSSVMEPLGRVLGVNIEAGEGEAAEPVVEEEDADASSKSPESSLARTSSAAASPEIESPESQSISITVTEGGTMTATSPSASPSPGDDNPSQQLQQSGKIMQVGRIQKAGGGKFHPPVRGEGESVPLRNSKHAGGEKVISLRDSKPYSEQYQNRGRSKNKMKPEGEASSSSSKKKPPAKGRKGSSAKKTKRKSEKGKKNGGKKNGGGRSSSRKSSSSSRGSKPKSASRDKKKEKKAKGEGEAAAPPHQQHHYRKSSSSYSSQKGESGSSAAKKEDRLDHLRKKEAQLLQDRDHKDARQQHDPPRKIMKQKGESTSSILNKNKKSKRELVKAEGEAQRSSLGNKSKRVVKAEGEAVSDRGKEESSEIEISSDSEDDPFGEFENEHMDQYGEKIGQVDLDEDNPGRARYKHGGGIVTRAGQTANRGLREGQKGLNDYANQRTEVQQTGYLAANYQGRNAMIETLATAIQTLRQNVSDLTEGMPFVATGLIDVTRPWLSQRLHFAASHDAHLLNTAVDQMQLQMLYDESCAERCGMVHMLEKLGATAADSKRLMYERNLLGGKNVNHVIRNVCNTLRDTLITAIVQCMRNFASVDSRDMTMEDQEGVAEHIQREVDSLVADFGLIGNLRDAIYEKYLGTEVAQWMQTFLQSESAFASVKRNDVGALLQAFGIDLHFRNVVVTIAFTTANYLYRQFSTQQVQLNQKGGMAAEEILKCGRFDFTEIELAVLSPEQREEYENNRRKKRDKRTALQRLEDQEREEEKHVTNLNLDLRVVNSFLIQEYSIYRSANDPESTYAMQDSQGTGFLVDVPVFSDVQIARGSKNLAALVRQRIQVLTKRAAGLSKIMGATDRGTLLYEDRPEVQELEYWRSKMVEIQSYARMATDINNIGKQIKDFHPELDKKAMRQGNDVKFLEKSKAHFDLQLRLQFIRQAIGLKLRLYQTALSHFQHRSMADSAAVDYKGDPTVKHFTLK
ncbi:unnamed protein product [Amoebophrya sp. A25]|nr:unnamed protein product [Amoebophrya sp. A25]|eukprot:GSA25T00025409001.1